MFMSSPEGGRTRRIEKTILPHVRFSKMISNKGTERVQSFQYMSTGVAKLPMLATPPPPTPLPHPDTHTKKKEKLVPILSKD